MTTKVDRIARDLTPDLLRLRTRALLPAIMERYGVSRSRAGEAVGKARVQLGIRRRMEKMR